MNKLLFFASDYKIGLSSLLTDEYIAFSKAGMNICAIAGETEQESGLYQKIIDAKLPIVSIAGLDEHKNFQSLLHKIASIIKEKHIDTVHVQNNWQLALLAFVKLRLIFQQRIKIIYTLHAFRHNSPLKSIVAIIVIGTALFMFADKIICMCSYLKNKFRLLSYKIVVLPLGITDSFFSTEYAPVPLSGLQMVFPAQFRKGKNQDILIKAFAKYLSCTDDVQSRLVLPGSGPLLSNMKKLAESLRVSNRIIFPGQCTKEEIKQWYLDSNIGVVASNSETFGQSIVEPFVLGRCVISTHVGVAIDLIKDGENGFLFTDEVSFVKILEKLHLQSELIAEIGIRNYKNRHLFEWSHIAQQYRNKLLY